MLKNINIYGCKTVLQLAYRTYVGAQWSLGKK